MIITEQPDPALARAILIELTARPTNLIPLDELAAEIGDDPEDLRPTLDAMERAGQVERPWGTDRIALGAGAARRLGRPHPRIVT